MLYRGSTLTASDTSFSPETDVRAAPIPEGPEFSNEPVEGGMSDGHNGAYDDPLGQDDSRVQFSAGDDCPDPLAESLARALRAAGIDSGWLGDGERPLHEEEEEVEEVPDDHEDPFYSEGEIESTILPLRVYCTNSYEGPGMNTKSSQDLLDEWFSNGAEGAWFPYPDKAVCSPCELLDHNTNVLFSFF